MKSITRVKIDNLTFKEDCIKDYIRLLLKKEFQIFVYDKKDISWFMFGFKNQIGSCEYNSWGFTFSTKHKPNRETGTGYQTETEVSNPIELNAIGTFIKYPSWEKYEKNKSSIVKYKGLKEYFEKETILEYFEVLR